MADRQQPAEGGPLGRPGAQAVRPAPRPSAAAAGQHHHEELEIGLAAAYEVNRHLNAEVEKLTLAVEALESERSAYKRHMMEVARQLAAARQAARQAMANQGDSQQQAVQQEQQVAAAEQQEGQQQEEGRQQQRDESGQARDVAAAPAAAPAADGALDTVDSWVQMVDWEALRKEGHEQGWLISSDDVFLGEKIGQGTFGSVYRSLCRGGFCAVKCVSPHSDDEGVNFVREVEALAQVRHPNVMAMYGACVEPPDRCWIVCEYLPGGSLSAWLYGPPGARRPPQRPLSERLRMALEVARGMQALEEHDPQILHRDLKPSNVFLGASGEAKVADFGLSRILTPAAMCCLTGETGSYLWMSPEVVRHEPYNSRSDVWSWGVMCVELLTQQRPYSALYATPVQLALQVAEGKLEPAIPQDCHPLLATVLAAAFDPDPLNRPSFGLIVSELGQVVEDVASAEAAATTEGHWARWFGGKQQHR